MIYLGIPLKATLFTLWTKDLNHPAKRKKYRMLGVTHQTILTAKYALKCFKPAHQNPDPSNKSKSVDRSHKTYDTKETQ